MPRPYKRIKFGVKKAYKKSSAKGAKSFAKRDRFATLANGPSPYPVSLRAGQGSYSRSAFARSAVKADLEVKNFDQLLAFTPVVTTAPPTTVGVNLLRLQGLNNNYFRVNIGPLVGPNVPTADTLCSIAQGNGSNNREGRKIVVKGIETRLTFTQVTGSTAALAASTWRVITYLDKQCNGSGINDTDLLNPKDEVRSLYNLENAQRFTILDDYTMEFNAQAVAVANNVAVTKNKVSKIVTNIPMEFSLTTGDTLGIRSNNISMLITGTGADGGAADKNMEVIGTSRILFVG